MAVRDSDTLLWLHNKLGVDNSWGSGNIASLLTADVLRNVIARQDELETRVKIKLLMSFIDIKPDAMESMKSEVGQVISACAEEENPWLQLIAEILRPFPEERRLETDISDRNGFFRETLEAIKRDC
jgi:negative elongation factor A